MLMSAPQGTHFGIEPIPQQYNFLKEKYAPYNNVNIINIAASNHYGTTPDQIFHYFSEKSMLISTLDNFIKNKPALTIQEFNTQYFNKINYYFVAYF